MGTVSTAAVPVIARGAQAQTLPATPSANSAKPVDITLTVNDREHGVAVDVRTSLLDLLRERHGLTGAKRAATTANATLARFWSMAVVSCPVRRLPSARKETT